jgi:hypothetical protein
MDIQTKTGRAHRHNRGCATAKEADKDGICISRATPEHNR